MKTPEDEEFERIETESGWRKRQIALNQKAENAKELGLNYEPEHEPVCDKDPQGCWNVRCQLGKKCKNTSPQHTDRNQTLEEVAQHFDKMRMGDTSVSFAIFVRGLKR